MKLSLAIQLTVLLVTLVTVTSAQDQRAKVVHELDALLEIADTEADGLTDREKGEIDVIRQLKDAIQDGGVSKREVEQMVREKRWIPWPGGVNGKIFEYIYGKEGLGE